MGLSNRLTLLAITLLVMVVAAQAQRFEDSPFVQAGATAMIPVGAGTSLFSAGPGIVLSIGTPIAGTALTSFQLTFLFPSVEINGLSSTITGIGANIALPFAPEAATTMYIAAGLGGYKNSISGGGSSVSSDWKAGVDGGVGLLLAPENWSSVFLDFFGRYRRIFTSGDQWEDLSFGASVGIHFL